MIRIKEGLAIRKIDVTDVENNWDAFLWLRNDIDTALQILSRPLGQTRQDILNWVTSRNTQSGCFFFGIFHEERFIGYVMFTEECRISGVGEISITLIGDARGKGIAADALKAFMDYLHGALEYRKFFARILADNIASINAFKKNGFALVGILKDHRKIGGRYCDIQLLEKVFQ